MHNKPSKSTGINNTIIPLQKLPVTPHLRLAKIHRRRRPPTAVHLRHPTQVRRRKRHKRIRARLLAQRIRHGDGRGIRDARARALGNRLRPRVLGRDGDVGFGDEVDAGFDGDAAADGVGDGLVLRGAEGGGHGKAVGDGEEARGRVAALRVGDHGLLTGLGEGGAVDGGFAVAGVEGVACF